MKPKVTKFIFGGFADISISRLECTEANILKIIDLFEHKTVIMEIGDVEIYSTLFQSIKSLSAKYSTPLNSDSPYADVVLLTDGYNLNELIHCILISDCESFSIEKVENHNT